MKQFSLMSFSVLLFLGLGKHFLPEYWNLWCESEMRCEMFM